jgi:hypothetical protein
MKSILNRLYWGGIVPWERRDPTSEEHLEMVRKIEAEERYFMEKLPPEDLQRFQTLSDLKARLSRDGEESLFSYAFSLGLLLALDVAKEAEMIAAA